jgi:hypothetical protein
MGAFFMGAVFVPAALLSGFLLYYTHKMRAA